MLNVKKILCPTDFSEPSYKGLEYAVELATLFQAEVHLLFVLPILPALPRDPNFTFEVPEYERMVHKDAQEKLNELVKTRIPSTIKTEIIISHGNPAKEIVRIGEESKVDMIVIATQGHTGWHHFVLGSVAEKVIRHAHCPVFAIREPRH